MDPTLVLGGVQQYRMSEVPLQCGRAHKAGVDTILLQDNLIGRFGLDVRAGGARVPCA